MRLVPVSALSFTLAHVTPRRVSLFYRAGLVVDALAPGAIALAVCALAFTLSFPHDLGVFLAPGGPDVVEGRVISAVGEFSEHRTRTLSSTIVVAFAVDGRQHTVTRVTPGDSLAFLPEVLTVHVDRAHPARARVEGTVVMTGRALFTRGVLVFVALAIALVLFVAGVATSRAQMAFLVHGVLVEGRRLAPSDARIAYVIDGRDHVRTPEHGRREALMDEAREPVLVDARDPTKARLLDELFLEPRIGDDGVARPTRTAPFRRALLGALASLSFVALVVAQHAISTLS